MPSERTATTFRFLAAPTDVGQSGVVSAGRVLEWIDKAGYAEAIRWCGGYAVTAYVGNVHFHRSVEVGHMVEVRARLIHTGRTSMHILVEAFSGGPRDNDLKPATRCLMIFVAMDGDKSTPVPALEPDDEASKLLQRWALRRAQVRAEIEEEMLGQVYSSEGTAPKQTLRFLAEPMDVNWGGKVHGGFVMHWIDQAAHVLATCWSGNPSNVAIFTGGVRFYRPMLIGDLVEVEARLLHTGSKSMHIGVHVRSGNPAEGRMETTTYCRTVFVALSEDGNEALPTPRWEPKTAEDHRLDEHAQKLVDIRAKFED